MRYKTNRLSIRKGLLPVLMLLLFSGGVMQLFSQQQYAVNIEWNDHFEKMILENGEQVDMPYFFGAEISEQNGGIPVYTSYYALSGLKIVDTVYLENQIFEEVPVSPDAYSDWIAEISEEICIDYKTVVEKRGSSLLVRFTPLRRNTFTGKLERLLYADVTIIEDESTTSLEQQTKLIVEEWAEESVLATGVWHKIAIAKAGVYEITYEKFQEMGVDPSGINPDDIRVYGNGGAMLSEVTSESRYDDLVENAIVVKDGNDGSFDVEDKVLFYGDGITQWNYDNSSGQYVHTSNLYGDKNYYYVTTSMGEGKRVEISDMSGTTPNRNVTSFDDYLLHEVDTYNLAQTGRMWFGEVFNVQTSYEFDYALEGLVKEEGLSISSSLAARSLSSSNFILSVNGGDASYLSMARLSSLDIGDNYADIKSFTSNFDVTATSISVLLEYNKGSFSSAIGWLDYFTLNFRRSLRIYNNQVLFRDQTSVGQQAVTEFSIGNATNNTTVWDITNIVEPIQMQASLSSGTLSFINESTTLHEYVSFNNEGYLTPQFVKRVGNQNLHALQSVDMVILSHPDFLSYANEVAAFHRSVDNMEVEVVAPEKIYNEFSSGKPDVSAIRDFVRMLYIRAPQGDELSHLLMFGDGSYDYRGLLGYTSSWVPTWESGFRNADPTRNIASDDFFALLDDDEGYLTPTAESLTGIVDIAVGRFPVNSPEQAQVAIDKMFNYVDNSAATMGEWRTTMAFIADDEDHNAHIIQSESLSAIVDTTQPEYLIKKIYLDAFPQVSTPSGQRFPAGHDAIVNTIEEGVLVSDYMGHGGINGWGHERFLEREDISGWTNLDRLTFFVTGTCEFCRFDEAGTEMPGELAFNNPNGGAIGLLTTTRATYGSHNTTLSKRFFEHLFDKKEGKPITIGEVSLLAKREYGGNVNGQKFVLICNPAIRLAYPCETVNEIVIEDAITSQVIDTVSALLQVTVKGKITTNGIQNTNFNGEVLINMFDKISTFSTLGQDLKSYVQEFQEWSSLLYKGRAVVTSGAFEVSFLIPRDINYNYGLGKMLLYASDLDNKTDAMGYFDDYFVGGVNPTPPDDEGSPQITLFMNDSTFVNGGLTDENPMLLVKVETGNGINITGSAIGHDITAVIDDDVDNVYVLNNYYITLPNTYKKGEVYYPLYDLSAGRHSMEVTVWDVYNNVTTATLDFIVSLSGVLTIEDFYTMPNPMTTSTSFTFEHNQAGRNMDVLLQVYDMSGRLIKTIDTRHLSEGFNDTLKWDGTNENGQRVANGIYIGALIVSNSEGQSVKKTTKMILLGN